MVATRAGVELESVDSLRETGTYRAEYDQATTPASIAVIAAVSDAFDVNPAELDPLYDSLDPDALDGCIRAKETTNGAVNISFGFEGHAIAVSSEGVVTVSSPDPEMRDSQAHDYC